MTAVATVASGLSKRAPVPPAPALGPRPSRPTFRARHADRRRRRQRVWQVDPAASAGGREPAHRRSDITQRPRHVATYRTPPGPAPDDGARVPGSYGPAASSGQQLRGSPQRGFCAGRLSLSPGLDVPVRSLSKGNSQKVVLAQAFLAPVGLLLLDEPWSGLDRDRFGGAARGSELGSEGGDGCCRHVAPR